MNLKARIERALAHAVLRLPRALQRPLAGAPIRLQGRELDLQTQLLLKLMQLSGARPWPERPLPQTRRQFETEAGLLAPTGIALAEVRDLCLEGPAAPIPARLYRPKGLPPAAPCLVFYHGGGFTLGSIRSHDLPCRWLAAVTPCVVVSIDYRLGPEHAFPAAVDDALAGFREVRRRAAELGLDPARIAVGGDSAGGNLAAITATRFDQRFYPPLDAADQLSPRPDFAGLVYPVISLQPPYDGTRSRRELGTQGDAVQAYSAELHVSGATPPTFLAHAADDPIAAVGQSLVMFGALRAKSVPAELHVFENGGHGWGLGQPGSLVSAWPRLFAAWARSHGFMGGAAPPQAAPHQRDDD